MRRGRFLLFLLVTFCIFATAAIVIFFAVFGALKNGSKISTLSIETLYNGKVVDVAMIVPGPNGVFNASLYPEPYSFRITNSETDKSFVMSGPQGGIIDASDTCEFQNTPGIRFTIYMRPGCTVTFKGITVHLDPFDQ